MGLFNQRIQGNISAKVFELKEVAVDRNQKLCHNQTLGNRLDPAKAILSLMANLHKVLGAELPSVDDKCVWTQWHMQADRLQFHDLTEVVSVHHQSTHFADLAEDPVLAQLESTMESLQSKKKRMQASPIPD